jgi:hypothetical protein
MTITITVRKDSQGRVSNVAREELTGVWIATAPVYSKLIEIIQNNSRFDHSTFKRVK